MKRIFLIVLLALLSSGTIITSCSKDNPISCAEKLVEVTSTQQAYVLDDSYENCIAYKNALDDYINCDGITDKVYYQALYDNLQCN